MSHRYSARARRRRARIRRLRLVGLVVVVTAIAAALAYEKPAASTVLPPIADIPRSDPPDRAVLRGSKRNLDRALLKALRRAAAGADDDGVELVIDSGWRSPEYQAQLLNEAIAKYGSEQEAARWVATPNTSAHVSGDAVDIGPTEAAAWLSEHGAAYGLCQIYDNEPWHFELRREAVDQGCPPTYADPTHDPRMQQ